LSVRRRPGKFDRLIIHQFDLHSPSPGGIDTCIRGLLRHKPVSDVIAVVGVSVGSENKDLLGKWQDVEFEGGIIHFMPVVCLDPANQKRFIPHSLRLMMGLIKYRRRIPQVATIQAHRADTSFVSSLMFRKSNLIYSIHTQGGGLSSKNSDSMWRFLSRIHRRVEDYLVTKAHRVLVFNPEYGQELQSRRPNVLSCPTWFEEYNGENLKKQPRTVFWAGRLEYPKNPILALESMAKLAEIDPQNTWAIKMAGVGTLSEDVLNLRHNYSTFPNLKIEILGRVSPEEMARQIEASSLFLMTSRPGYEGFPRVLVEAMAGGLPSVVTVGSDTGKLIVPGENGAVVSPDSLSIARALLDAQSYDTERARHSVRHLNAKIVVANIYNFTGKE